MKRKKKPLSMKNESHFNPSSVLRLVKFYAIVPENISLPYWPLSCVSYYIVLWKKPFFIFLFFYWDKKPFFFLFFFLFFICFFRFFFVFYFFHRFSSSWLCPITQKHYFIYTWTYKPTKDNILTFRHLIKINISLIDAKVNRNCEWNKVIVKITK